MPTWLTIQLATGVLWFFCGIILYRIKFWKVTFPFGFNSGIIILLLIFLPVSWLGTLIIIELYFIIKEISFSPFRLIIPSLLLIHLLIQVIYYRKNKQLANYLEDKCSIKRQECIQWLEKFNFINQDDVNIQIYEVKGLTVGKIVVEGITDKEATELKAQEKSLPENTHLFILRNQG